jgi:hypothetical protein
MQSHSHLTHVFLRFAGQLVSRRSCQHGQWADQKRTNIEIL